VSCWPQRLATLQRLLDVLLVDVLLVDVKEN
jgi:hypothetical protein